ncbi:MAG TPA: AsnC family protein [Candidatus Limnocylindria bacterium]|nr:AsnC family protein [Candidatus Limnocylindria bacterium]
MDTWWSDIDDEILALLTANGPMTPADLARKLGMSAEAVCSCIGMLSAGGTVRIRSVEATPGACERAA